MQSTIAMVCTTCKHENYITRKNKRTHSDRLERNKFCPNCNKATGHKEKKK